MGPNPPTQFRLTLNDRTALDAIADEMGVDRSTAVRKLIYEETERRGLTDHVNAAFVAQLIESYHANAVVKVATNGGATPAGANITISGHKPTEARAVLLAGAEADELRIEDPATPASVVVATMENERPGELRWEGTLGDLAAIVPASDAPA